MNDVDLNKLRVYDFIAKTSKVALRDTMRVLRALELYDQLCEELSIDPPEEDFWEDVTRPTLEQMDVCEKAYSIAIDLWPGRVEDVRNAFPKDI